MATRTEAWFPEPFDPDTSSPFHETDRMPPAHSEPDRRRITGRCRSPFAGRDLSEHHHHLVCSNCGTVQDVLLPRDLERRMEGALTAAAASAGFSHATHRVDVIGTCRDCA